MTSPPKALCSPSVPMAWLLHPPNSFHTLLSVQHHGPLFSPFSSLSLLPQGLRFSCAICHTRPHSPLDVRPVHLHPSNLNSSLPQPRPCILYTSELVPLLTVFGEGLPGNSSQHTSTMGLALLSQLLEKSLLLHPPVAVGPQGSC